MRILEILSKINEIAKMYGLSQPYICGGLPRDKIVGISLDKLDIDITSGDSTIHKLALLTHDNIGTKNIIKKAKDGHYKIIFPGIDIDFSSNFLVPGIDEQLLNMGIKQTSLNKEMFSRDFTCNTLLMTLDLKRILDPSHKGITDINNKIIRTCLDPDITLRYSDKRVVRSIYLAAKLKFLIDKPIIEWVKRNPSFFISPGQSYITKKLKQAFQYDKEITSRYLTMMNLWSMVPSTEELLPYIKGAL